MFGFVQRTWRNYSVSAICLGNFGFPIIYRAETWCIRVFGGAESDSGLRFDPSGLENKVYITTHPDFSTKGSTGMAAVRPFWHVMSSIQKWVVSQGLC